MESKDTSTGEGPSTPRYQLARNNRGRLSLVSDIENISGDEYYPRNDADELSPTGSLFAAGIAEDSIRAGLQYPTVVSPTRTNLPGQDQIPQPPTSFPTSGGLPVPSTESYGPSVPSVYGPSIPSTYGPPSTYGLPVPQAYGTPGSSPYPSGLGVPMPHDARMSIISDQSIPDLGYHDDLTEGNDTDKSRTLTAGSHSSQQGHTERSDSIHTQSSVGALGSKDPYGTPLVDTENFRDSLAPPPPFPPPKIPLKGQNFGLELRTRQESDQTINTMSAASRASQPPPVIRTRQESNQTASSFAMFTPISPIQRQVRFSNADMKTVVPGEGSVPPLPIPPHVIEMLRNTQPKPRAPHYFHGPPPPHGAENPPPEYITTREVLLSPTLTPTLTPDGRTKTWSEKVGLFDPTDKDPSKPWWRRRKGYCFWIIVGLAGLAIVVGTIIGIVIGREMGQRRHRNGWWAARNSTEMPPPGGFLGTWAYTTTLMNETTGCAPTADGQETDLWRCAPYETPPSASKAVWSFFISRRNMTNETEIDRESPLFISSGGNPFAYVFPSEHLYLMRYPNTNTSFYQFSLNYTRTSSVVINGREATCEFPNSILTAKMFVNNTEFRWKKGDSKGNAYRGEWPGNVYLTEEKFGGGKQVVCRDKESLDVISLNDVTAKRGMGNCLCDYQKLGPVNVEG
ncbi:hypothetical protein TWF102_002221 [Orbilia oligospora]|uniref:Uncharacterized protein n=1 Tax=Orbilia oligospora TaxID=2813651 RepID=A0A7C8J021_ORBOL|nr:hypothetical protein TWF102_002221 [Orbilia oligospora]KAF3088470.1 hypothetical protein TWF103_001155 [Orbilia oligospora]KAF3088471.1 hypothetical protein TWF103_001155 [Orbilia oligospora]KAF3092872.1 hypothetical protein TWF706_008865 [Orbilia oligospora]KAF3135645.1 hypothetical protein TWF594_008368 [Orbilia oligospora]